VPRRAAGHEQRLLLVVQQQAARVQVLVALLPGLQALGVVRVAVQDGHLRARACAVSLGCPMHAHAGRLLFS
jgi:hypothetical protein